MSLSYVVDGETELDSELFNPIIDRVNGDAGPLANMRAGVANVLDYGAVGDGITNDRPAIQDAIDSGAARIVFPVPSSFYAITDDSLEPKSNQSLCAEVGAQYLHQVSGSVGKPRIGASASYDGPVFEFDTRQGITFEGITVTGSGSASHANSTGIKATNAGLCSIRNCMFSAFGGPAVQWVSGNALELVRNLATNSVLKRTGQADYIGVFDLGGSDVFAMHNESNAGQTQIDTGYIAAYAIRGANGFFHCNVGEFSEVGYYIDDNGSAIHNGFYGNRADLNWGHGWVVAGNSNLFVGNRSYRNGRAMHNTYDGFVVTGLANNFIANQVANVGADSALAMRYGFSDTSSASGDGYNSYALNRARGIVGALYSISDTDQRVFDPLVRSTVTGATADDKVDSLIAALVTAGLIVDGTT